MADSKQVDWRELCDWAEPQGLEPHDRQTQQAFADWKAMQA